MGEKLLGTVEVAGRLGVSHPTVKLWCRKGRFPHATLEETGRGPLWQIPESDLEGFVPPRAGRPPKAKEDGAAPEAAAAKARAVRVIKKGGKK